MANKTEDQQGMMFVGCTIVGTGIGLVISAITGDWLYTGAGSVIGVGLGFIGMSTISKK